MKKLIIPLLLLIAVQISAQKFDFSGYGATGIKFYDRNKLNNENQETYYEGKFQVDLNLKKGFEAQLDFRGNNIDKSVELREFSAKYESDSWYNIKVGNIKQPFGYEYLINRDKLWSIDRSIVQDKISEIGYGTRTVSLMMYYEYDKKKPEIPYTYYVSIYKNNASASGAVARLGYYFNDDIALSGNYMYQNIGGENAISTSGMAADIEYRTKELDADFEIMYVQDPFEGQAREIAGLDKSVFSFGAKLLLAAKFPVTDFFIEDIEPVLVAGYFMPDDEISDRHTIQTIIGSNFYIDKDIRIRIFGDARFTKTEFSDDYSTKESRATVEFQVRF